MQIIIQPVPCSESELEYSSSSNSIIYSLIQHLPKTFGYVTNTDSSRSRSFFQASTTKIKLPTHLYDNRRNQWMSDRLLEWLLQVNKPDFNTKVLAICDFDAYSDELNFVFGEAHLGGRVAAIYLPRLRQDFYTKKSNANNNRLFEQRVIKEAAHELGHAFGLRHCRRSRCVMHFSNSLEDTDFKDNIFCEGCNIALRSYAA